MVVSLVGVMMVGVMMVGLVAEVPCGWDSVVAMIVVYLSVCLDWKDFVVGNCALCL